MTIEELQSIPLKTYKSITILTPQKEEFYIKNPLLKGEFINGVVYLSSDKKIRSKYGGFFHNDIDKIIKYELLEDRYIKFIENEEAKKKPIHDLYSINYIDFKSLIVVTKKKEKFIICNPYLDTDSSMIMGKFYKIGDVKNILNISGMLITDLERVDSLEPLDDGNFGLPQLSGGNTNKEMIPVLLFGLFIFFILYLMRLVLS